jgi:pyruvate formate lyase activating enzyme
VSEGEEVMGYDEFFAFLESRRGRLEGVCVSGGEPTIHRELPEFLGRIKDMGYAVKLDTNGTNPEMLAALINDGLVDYVAMDIKNSPERYEDSVVINAELIDRVVESASLLMEGRVDFEFRTTLMREMHGEEEIRAIGRWLSGDEKFFLQTYRDEGDLLVGGFTPHSEEEKKTLVNILREYIPNAKLR